MERNLKMKKLMIYIKELLFGRRADAVCQIKLGCTTIYPPNQPNEWEWKQEFRVGMLHGKKTVYLN
jgi:hypothetical protein